MPANFEGPYYFSTDLELASREHVITLLCSKSKLLKIEVRDSSSLEEWHATYSSDYIEELTQKTGNFKSFDVFLSMLYSVVTHKSNTLLLDLVKYEDLQSSRQLNTPFSKRRIVTLPVTQKQRRYLILSYVTAFDRTVYPLPLVYTGVPDKKKLFNQIHKLREELYNSKKHTPIIIGPRFQNDGFEKKIKSLQKERDDAVREAAQIRAVLKVLHVNDISSSEEPNSLIGSLIRGDSYPRTSPSTGRQQERRDTPLKNFFQTNTLSEKHGNISKKNNKLVNQQFRRIPERPSKNKAILTLNNSQLHEIRNPVHHRSPSAPRSSSLSSRGCSAYTRSFERLDNCSEALNAPTVDVCRRGSPGFQLRKRTHSADSVTKRCHNPVRFNPTAYIEERERKLRSNSMQRKRIESVQMNNNRISSENRLTKTYQNLSHSFISPTKRSTPLRPIETGRVHDRISLNSESFSSPNCSPHKFSIKGPNLIQNTSADRGRYSKKSTNHRFRSPQSQRLLAAAGILSDSESEGFSLSENRRIQIVTPKCNNQRKSSQRISSVRNDSDSDSLVSLRIQNRRNSGIQETEELRFNHRKGSPRNSHAKTVSLESEMDDMDERLDILQNFFKNYFI